MENKKALGIGVVGCGSTGIQSVLQHTCEEDKGNLVYTAAVMDPVPGRAQYCAEKVTALGGKVVAMSDLYRL